MTKLDLDKIQHYAVGFAKTLAQSPFIPAEIRGDVTAVAHVIATGLEMGFTPSMALRSFWVSRGLDGSLKLTLTADAMLALLFMNGVKVSFVEDTPVAVTVRGVRKDGQERTVRYTLDDAKRAGLLYGRDGKPRDNWAKHPSRMLRARAVGAIFRDLGPDYGYVGIYAPEEFDEPEPERPPAETGYVIGRKAPAESKVAPGVEEAPEIEDEEELEEEQPEAIRREPLPDVPEEVISEAIATLRNRSMLQAMAYGMPKSAAASWIRTVVKAATEDDATDQIALLSVADRLTDWLAEKSPLEHEARDAAEMIRASDEAAQIAEELSLGEDAIVWLRLLHVVLEMDWDRFREAASKVPVEAIRYWFQRAATADFQQSAKKFPGYLTLIEKGIRAEEAWDRSGSVKKSR